MSREFLFETLSSSFNSHYREMFHFHIYILFLTLLFTCFANIQDATGENFVDKFTKYHPALWTKNDFDLTCTHHTSCVSFDENFALYNYLPKTRENVAAHELLLVLMRGSQGESIFCESECDVCAEYTSGGITSTHRYAYGTFWFLFMAADTPKHFANNNFPVKIWSK